MLVSDIERKAAQQIFVLLEMIQNPKKFKNRLKEMQTTGQQVDAEVEKLAADRRAHRDETEAFEKRKADFETEAGARTHELDLREAKIAKREAKIADRDAQVKEAQEAVKRDERDLARRKQDFAEKVEAVSAV